MRICLVGSGGREHALALSLAKSAEVAVTPGNAGIDGESEEGHRFYSLDAAAEEIEADLYVIGPEAPLVDGLADRLRAAGRLVFGPGRDGARLEGSKTYMKKLARAAGVPTADWASFGAGEEHEALLFLRNLGGGYVVKADGLAAGKGVLVTSDLRAAEEDLADKLSGQSFGEAGRQVVIEEALSGDELSLFVATDGKRALAFSPAQDYKALAEGGEGPNTGGMGAYSPVPAADDELVTRLLGEIVEPTLEALRADGVSYRGLLYVGLMLTATGPRLIEFNVRFGDPETEAILPRLGGGLTELLAAAAEGDLSSVSMPAPVVPAAVTVVVASPGYPSRPETGAPITGLEAATSLGGVHVFHAGTARDANGRLVSAGGRVLAVTGLGESLETARDKAYEAVAELSFPGMQLRRDIALAPLGAVR